jgi:hypothetical protein
LRGTVGSPEGKPLAAASVFLAGTSYGTLTNEAGSFVLPLPLQAGTYSLTISFTGYATFQQTLSLPQAQGSTLHIVLYPKINCM